MAEPEDSAETLSALRLGWYIAEVPDKPGAHRQDVVMTEEIRKRTLTTAADAAVP